MPVAVERRKGIRHPGRRVQPVDDLGGGPMTHKRIWHGDRMRLPFEMPAEGRGATAMAPIGNMWLQPASTSRWRGAGIGLALALMVAGCSTTVTKHGQLLTEQDVAQVQPGMHQEQVRSALGTPATTAAIGRGNAFYYISTTMTQSAFFAPVETDRRVVAVYFTQSNTVDRVAHYGMKDGKVFDFVSRSTPSANTAEDGILKSLFRNLGQKQLGL